MERNNYPGGFNRVFRTPRGLKEKPWQHDDLNVLQLDFVDRHVVKIAGKIKVLIFKKSLEIN